MARKTKDGTQWADLSPSLPRGLRREERAAMSPFADSRDPRGGLVQLQGVRVADGRLEAPDAIADPHTNALWDTGVAGGFGYSRVLKGEQAILFVVSNALYEVDSESFGPTALTVYEAGDLATGYPTKGSSVTLSTDPQEWHLAESRGSWILFGEDERVWKLGTNALHGGTEYAYHDDTIVMRTGCVHRGRWIWGGFDPGSFFASAMETFLSDWWTRNGGSVGATSLVMPTIDNVGENWVGWGQIGGGDALLWLCPYLAQHGWVPEDLSRVDPEKHWWLEQYRAGRIGFFPMPWQGRVLCTKPIGHSILVYGEQGISQLVMAQAADAPVYGLRHLLDVGVFNRWAVGGDDTEHIFIDRDCQLWIANERDGPVCLGYREFFDDYLVDSEDDGFQRFVVIELDARRQGIRDYYISVGNGTADCGVDTFILSPHGLSRAPQDIHTGIVGRSSTMDTVRLCAKPITGMATDCLITLDRTDFGIRGLKHLQWMHFTGSIPAGGVLSLGADYRMEEDDSWTTGSWVTANARGEAFIGRTAHEFRPKVKIAIGGSVTTWAGTGLVVDGLHAQWELLDRRGI